MAKKATDDSKKTRRRLSKKQTLILSGGLFAVFYAALFVVPAFKTYSFAGDTCVYRPILAPTIYREQSDAYDVELRSNLKIGNAHLMSLRQCITAQKMPKPGVNSVAYAPLGVPIFQYTYRVRTPELPKLNIEPLDKPVPTSRPLAMKLDVLDDNFTYSIATAEERSVKCKVSGDTVTCPVKELDLPQGAEVPLTILRSFKNETEKIVEKTIKTLSAASIIDSSVGDGSTIYEKVREFTFKSDKPLASALATVKKSSDDAAEVASTVELIDPTTIKVTIADDLEREVDYQVVVDEVVAEDGSGLVEPHRVGFHTSGGPKVESSSIGGSGVVPNAAVRLTFDQPLLAGQNLAQYISVGGGSATVSQLNDRQVLVQLQMAKCADFTITVNKGLLSNYEVPQTQAWTQKSRTSCYTLETIGYSAQGRPINAYFFGDGASTVMFVGAIHGNEASSSYILQDLVGHLEANAKRLPAGRQVVVVTTINPDGFSRASRANANGVNLNRNFATSDWKSDINDTNGSHVAGGGKTSMSEPETKAIAALSSRLRPRLVLSYHAVGSVAIANQAGDSASLANTYARTVGYSNGTGNSSEIFTYEITGTYDDWLRERLGVPSIVVELGSYSYRNFAHHQPAMWAMIES